MVGQARLNEMVGQEIGIFVSDEGFFEPHSHGAGKRQNPP